jgi:hypothetical protein
MVLKNIELFPPKEESQQGDSNPRPTDYESVALPLSYTGPLKIIRNRLKYLFSRQLKINKISLNCQEHHW